MRAALSVGEILDESADCVRLVAAPWLGVLWLTSLPLRMAQAHFAARLIELGREAQGYGDHLSRLALVSAATLLLSLWGRAVFANACRQALQGALRGAAVLRLRPTGLLSYAYVALLIEAVFYATCLSAVAVPVLALAAGLAAATLPFSGRAGLLRPLATLSGSAEQARPLVALLLSFGAGFLLAGVNLLALSQAGLWLARGVPGLELARWSGLLSPRYPRFLCVLLAGAWLAVEPWWLASLVVYVHKLRARATGEDLRLWFERLREAEA